MTTSIVEPELDYGLRQDNAKAARELAAFNGWEKDGVVLSATKVLPAPCGEPRALPQAWMDETGVHLVLTKWHLWQVGWGMLDGVILALSALIVYILLTQPAAVKS
jgi:hypothetical protein